MRRLVVPVLAGVAALLAGGTAAGPAASAPSGVAAARRPALHVVQRGGSRPAAGAGMNRTSRSGLAAVRAYWTAQRMATARPGEELAVAAGVRITRPSVLRTYLQRLAPGRSAPQAAQRGAPWTGGGAVARTTGKVFFSLGADDYVCSGSAVDSPDRSTVLTAGHCVIDPESGTTAVNWVFVPGYGDGRAPYGIFPATHLATTAGWRTGEDFDVDVAFANVGPNGAGRRLVDVVGAQSIAFGAARGQTMFAFGYPAVAPWTGERLIHCSGVVVQDTSPAPSTDQGMSCTMTPGSSGGPWFSRFDPRTGRGTLTSLTSFSYSDRPGLLWGPYLGPVAQSLYAAVASTPSA
ncbi:MAG: trypsin-like serine peptidase [Kineosporiaceae bacterium]